MQSGMMYMSFSFANNQYKKYKMVRPHHDVMILEHLYDEDGKLYDNDMCFDISKFVILIEQIRNNSFDIVKKNKTMYFIWKHDIYGISLILTKRDNKSFSSDEYILDGKNWSFSFIWDRAIRTIQGYDNGILRNGYIWNSEEFKKDYSLILLFMDVDEEK